VRVLAALLCLAACGDPIAGDAADARDVALDAAPPPYPPWTMVVLPDTQVYMNLHPEIWAAQTRWIAEHAAELDVRMVLHVGDVTEWNSPAEWARARDGFDEIEAVAPLVVVTGNHDYDVSRTRVSRLSEYWTADHLRAQPSFGGLFEADRTDNHYQRFTIAGQTWLVLGLEWGPRPSVLDWAASVLDAEPADHVVIDTHAYLYNDDRRYDWARWGDRQSWNPHWYVGTPWPIVSDGEELWQRVIADRTNVDLVVSGHVAVHGVGHATSRAAGDHPVHEVLQDYQGDELGGAGYLRLYTFFGDRIEIRTYSPYLDRFEQNPDDEFTLPWHP